MPRGVVALTTNLDSMGNDAYVDTETVVYTLSFTAAPKRFYKVHFQVYSVDSDGTGDNANNDIRYAKSSAAIRCRWASGSTVTTSSSILGAHRVTVFDDDSSTASGADISYFLINPPRGLTTVGITLAAARTPATYGKVRFLTSTGNHLSIEDVGPFSE